ncbi:methyl-accepting chemotaxis protein [Noviherbaspirillum sp. ST9]|uniref:methyl-accepting chemotaxis protein n=1 Tax=Noviherbaspirillum sp. ST9 TaxID=3401606 RepID=UPI003B58A6B5
MFRNITIKSRLILLVALLCTLMTMIGAGGIYALSNANAALDSVYADRLVPVGQLDVVIRTINRNQLTITTALVKGEAEYANAADMVKKAVDEGDKKWREYMATELTEAEKQIANQAETAMQNFNSGVVTPALAAFGANDTARLQELVRNTMSPLYATLRKPVNDLIQLQLDVARAEHETSVARYKFFMGLSIATLGAGLLIGVALAVWLIRSITRPINHAVEIAEAVAAGDLTHSVHIEANDETARLLNALTEMQTRLTAIVAGVREGTDSINTASREIAVGNNDLSARTEDQAASLEETASSMEELTSTVKQNADNSRQANQLAGSATEHATMGGEVVQEMVRTMADIRESSNRIVDIISVIDGIAFQTNILALNAAVEAARAGEQGRGFAVVATEVRSLAQRSASAAKEIKQLIGNAVEKVGQGSSLMDQTGETMEQIVQSVKQVADIINEISAASREQSEGIDQINQAIAQIDEATQQNAALVEESAAAAQSMLDQASTLSKAVSVFRIAGSHTASLTTVENKPVVAESRPKPAASVSSPKAAANVRKLVVPRKAALPAGMPDADAWEAF